MSTVDTSSWNPDADLNTAIEGIPLNASAGIAQTWKVIAILMAAMKGDVNAVKAMISVMEGATVSADGASGLVPKPLAGDHDKFLKGDGTWGGVPSPNLGTASRAVQTDANGALAVSSVTATELGYLSGVTSAVQTQLDSKATDSDVVHLGETETISGSKTFSNTIYTSAAASIRQADPSSVLQLSFHGLAQGAFINIFGINYSSSSYAGSVDLNARNSGGVKTLHAAPDGTLTWNGQAIQTASDGRLKTSLSAVPDEVLDAWEDVGWGQFQFLDAVRRKGDAARLHLGLIAQHVKAVFEARGLDACEYGILCHEKREADGEEPAVDLWMVRYEEAQAMEAACQRRRADRLEARIIALEEKLDG